MSRITRDKGALKWDDRIDVLAMLTAYWVDHLGQDTTAAAEAWRSEALAQELKSFEDYVFERSGGENLNWNQYCIDR
jgi:hypothetical protein